MKLDIETAALIATQAAASLRSFGKIGYGPAESLRVRADRVAQDERIATITRQSLAMSAMATAAREAAGRETDEGRRTLLLSAGDSLDVLSGIEAIQAVNVVRRHW